MLWLDLTDGLSSEGQLGVLARLVGSMQSMRGAPWPMSDMRINRRSINLQRRLLALRFMEGEAVEGDT